LFDTAVKHSSCSKYLVSVSKDGSIIVWVESNQQGDRSALDEKSFYHKATSVSGTGKYFTDVCLFEVKLNKAGLLNIVASAQDGSLSFYCLKDRARAEKELLRRQVNQNEALEENIELEFMYSTAAFVEEDKEL
jgi:WD40 repeat protein